MIPLSQLASEVGRSPEEVRTILGEEFPKRFTQGRTHRGEFHVYKKPAQFVREKPNSPERVLLRVIGTYDNPAFVRVQEIEGDDETPKHGPLLVPPHREDTFRVGVRFYGCWVGDHYIPER